MIIFIYCFDTSLLVCVSSHCSSSSKYLSPSLWFSPAFPHSSCSEWNFVLPHALIRNCDPWAGHCYWSSAPLFAIFQPLLPLLVTRGCLNLVLQQTLPWNPHWLWTSKENFLTVGHLLWSLSATLTSFIALYLLVVAHLSVCLHSLGVSHLILQYKLTATEILVGFTARFPKYKNNSTSKGSERRPAQHVSPVNRRVIVSLVPFITKTPLTETAHCPTADLYFLYHSMKLLWRFV